MKKIILIGTLIALMILSGCFGPCSKKWSGSGTLVAPGDGKHEYTYNDLDFSKLPANSVIEIELTIGDGESMASMNLYPAEIAEVNKENTQGTLCKIYDQGTKSTRTSKCTIKEPGLYKLGVEGNWFSKKGSTNTFEYKVSVLECGE